MVIACDRCAGTARGHRISGLGPARLVHVSRSLRHHRLRGALGAASTVVAQEPQRLAT